ncbi:hypothetical protein [Ovoidimarina sediminis]|uniref:hypothetical protein n=1 Tax=Ovoidimarina sediminis TaxID=3079856 RepID=UPI0029116099|nr:hypothetical protein [Rhodophyticola sp. MJ-SS7]MDU8942474.1 hypothetical protein [Rhodophyticola sp. MJ-SS7]
MQRGEPVPVDKAACDAVTGGMVNGSGASDAEDGGEPGGWASGPDRRDGGGGGGAEAGARGSQMWPG